LGIDSDFGNSEFGFPYPVFSVQRSAFSVQRFFSPYPAFIGPLLAQILRSGAVQVCAMNRPKVEAGQTGVPQGALGAAGRNRLPGSSDKEVRTPQLLMPPGGEPAL
jgi:hypothetical protein